MMTFDTKDWYDWTDPSGERFTPDAHPYAYSEFFLFGGEAIRSAKPGTFLSAYSDRMRQWDGDAWQRATIAAGKPPNRYMPKDVAQDFLSAYHLGKAVTLHALAEGCNHSSGYPYWIFFWTEEKVEPLA